MADTERPVLITILWRGRLHGSDDRATTWCGLPVPEVAPDYRPSFAQFPVCPICAAHNTRDALETATEWIRTQPDTRALVGSCGHAMALGKGDRDVTLRGMLAAALLPGFRIVKPTPEQIVDLVENERCAACSTEVAAQSVNAGRDDG